MKKLFAFLIGLMLFAPAFSQKDLEIKLLTPKTGDEIYDSESILLILSIKNVGTQMIVPEDSFFVSMKMDGEYIQGDFYKSLIEHANIPVGDSVLKTIYGFTFIGGQLDPFSFCFELETSNNGIRVDSNLTNNESCATIEVKVRTTAINPAPQANNTLVNIYPNPASSTVTIQSFDDNATKAIITDVTGRDVDVVNLETGINNLQVNSLANGIYVCKLINAQGTMVNLQKFVVSH
jgi:hypothetical protein